MKFIIVILIFFSCQCSVAYADNEVNLIEDNDVAMFVMLKYSSLAAEIVAGDGMHLDALIYLMYENGVVLARQEIKHQLKLSLRQAESIYKFAEAVKKLK